MDKALFNSYLHGFPQLFVQFSIMSLVVVVTPVDIEQYEYILIQYEIFYFPPLKQ